MRGPIVLDPKLLSARDIIDRACHEARCSREEMLGNDRSRWLAWPRQDLMLALRERGLSYPKIGRLLGDRDHTTIMHGVRKAKARRLCTSSQPVEIKGWGFDDEYVEFLHDMVKLEGAQLMESA